MRIVMRIVLSFLSAMLCVLIMLYGLLPLLHMFFPRLPPVLWDLSYVISGGIGAGVYTYLESRHR